MQYIELLSYCIYYISSFLLCAPLKKVACVGSTVGFQLFFFPILLADASHNCTMLYGTQVLCERKTGAFDKYIWLNKNV